MLQINFNIYTFLFTSTEARNILKRFREDQSRDSELIVSLWEEVIMENSGRLGDESK